MIFLLASSKSFSITTNVAFKNYTIPTFLGESSVLITELRNLQVENLKELLNVSSDLAKLNFNRYNDWHLPFTPKNSNRAILSFSGDVFKGLNSSDFDASDFDYAQANLRIISGLFGLLRPLDLIHPYRLEIGTQFRFANYKNLYDYWTIRVTDELNGLLKLTSDNVIVNLASQEYFKVVDAKRLNAKIINIEFKEKSVNGYKIVAIHAKRARGLMTRYAIKNKIINVEDLQSFNLDGYAFNSAQSNKNKWVFTR
ncbi:MAG: peroxide stress protein YaaA [Tenuifilaceae bacterium]